MITKLIGWKAWYTNNKVYTSKKHEWNNLKRSGLILLKKFYHVFDEDGMQVIDKESGERVFSELIYGHQMICLSIESIKEYKKLPKCLKFPEQVSAEELEKIIKIAEEDEEIIEISE